MRSQPSVRHRIRRLMAAAAAFATACALLPGVYDFSGVRDVDKLLDMAAQVGLYVIARPSPYINAEADGGGFPAWLDTKPGNDRHDDATYLAYADQWLSQIDPIIARHQLTNGTGTVIEYQVENEYYNSSADGRAYMQHLEDKARADGITVPLVGNNNGTFNSTRSRQSVTLPTTDTNPGVSWYVTTTTLHLPQGQDTSLGLNIADDPSRKYRAEIYVNGWDMGDYVNYVGPQNSFPIPNGVINPHGKNTIAIAVWNLDGSTGGLGAVSLTDYGSYASSLVVPMNDSPGYDAATYAMPKPSTANVALQAANTVSAGQQITATATLSVPVGKPSGSDPTADLQVPTGWSAVQTAGPSSTARIKPGGSATFTWLLTAPATVAQVSTLTVSASLWQNGSTVTATDARIVLLQQNAASSAASPGRQTLPAR